MGAWILAGVTFREAARKKLLWMALLAGLAFLALFGTGLHYHMKDFTARSVLIRRQVLNAMLMMGFYAVDLLTVTMTVLTSVDTLSGEISSGTIHAVATKPISRWQVLVGKWLGFVGMLTAYIILMVGGTAAVTYVLTGYTARHLVRGMSLILLESLLLLTVTFLFGTTFSTLTNGVLALGLHGLAFMGGWIEQVGAELHSPRAVTVGVVASIIMPSESLWRRAAYEMQSPLVGALGISPFSNASTPSLAMVGYAAVYVAMALALAICRFGRRDL
ncbi:MAG: ABC transporter permease [Acidobacteria bacterium]|nr:MAG: ABC transporter permease [Acidobacteriota bacterium]PYV25894.1 MAG: ABC transporter permease [Acidobacteriota bacterium]